MGDLTPDLFCDCSTLFGQSLDRALRFLDAIAAANTGPTEVFLKGEILHDPEVCADLNYYERWWTRDGQMFTERFRDLIERKVVSLDTYERIIDEAAKRRLFSPIMSVYDFEGADFARDKGCRLKIASSNLTHIPLIRHCAHAGETLFIDTGRGTIEEVARAVGTARDEGAVVYLGHSPDGHPALPEHHNLRQMDTMRGFFGCKVGLSDHWTGEEMCYAAVARGADWVEVSICDDPDEPDQDVQIAVPLSRLKSLADNMHAVWQAVGQPWRDPHAKIPRISSSARMGLYAAEDIYRGEPLTLDSVRFAWPAIGIGAAAWDEVEGRPVVESVPKGAPISWEDVGR